MEKCKITKLRNIQLPRNVYVPTPRPPPLNESTRSYYLGGAHATSIVGPIIGPQIFCRLENHREKHVFS
jgi:hypothetical protein